MRFERWLYTIPLRVRSLFRRDAVERELDDELRFHVERLTDEFVTKGLSPAGARLAALRAMNGVEQRKEECRDTRRVRIVEDLGQDLRYGARVLLRSPGFTAIAVLSLALGIGANTAIFQLIDALGVRPLPVSKPRDLAIVEIVIRGWPRGTTPDGTRMSRLRSGRPAPIAGVHRRARGGTWDVRSRDVGRVALRRGWPPGQRKLLRRARRRARGRPRVHRGGRRGGWTAPGVVLSHAFWQREFGGSPAAIGATLTVKDIRSRLWRSKAGFYGIEIGRCFDFAMLLCAEPLINGRAGTGRLDDREAWWLSIVGRLKPGLSVTRAGTQPEASHRRHRADRAFRLQHGPRCRVPRLHAARAPPALGILAAPPAGRHAAVEAARGRGRRSADCVRERRGPDARADGEPIARNGCPPVRSGPRAAASCGSCSSRACCWRCRSRPGVRGSRRGRAARSSRSSAAR